MGQFIGAMVVFFFPFILIFLVQLLVYFVTGDWMDPGPAIPGAVIVSFLMLASAALD